MKNIKKKSGWSLYSPPFEPVKPISPKKQFTIFQDITIKSYWGTDSIKLSDLELPDGCSYGDLVVETRYNGNNEYTNNIVWRVEKIFETPDYEKKLKQYEKDLSKWQEKMKLYHQEVKDWKEWVKQENESQLESKLEQAKKLLEKHGRKVT
jgi:hypothetical protein